MSSSARGWTTCDWRSCVTDSRASEAEPTGSRGASWPTGRASLRMAVSLRLAARRHPLLVLALLFERPIGDPAGVLARALGVFARALRLLLVGGLIGDVGRLRRIA